MEDERDREEYKHVCKLCNKRYPSGKSLGGHMRSHVIANSKLNKAAALLNKNNNNNINTVVDDVDDDVDDDDDVDEDEDEYMNDQKERENCGHSGYGLRENPKKTWRIVDSGLNNKPQQQPNQQQQERVCKQCGKGFQSLKALCGHMSSHSEKDRNFHKEEEEDDDDDNSWSSESHSDDRHTNNKKKNKNSKFEEGFIPSKRQTRSSMSRYRSLTAVDSLGGSSSNNSEIDQLEQEEVALCLMMLSRDSSSSYHKTSCFNHLATESSDNNSVILEDGSSSNFVVGGMSMSKGKDLNLMNSNCNKIKQQVNVEMDNSDSGYFENGAKELESDDSVDGYARNYCYSTYGLNKFNNTTTINNKIDLGSGLLDSYDDYSKKRVRYVVGNFGFDSPELEENNSRKKIKQDYYHETSNKYECVICNKTFKNHQALGGHIISHRRNGDNHHTSLDTSNSPFSSAKNFGASASTSTNNVATTSKTMLNNYAKKGSGSKKMKGHKCPYCPKVFKSGQALGGHKRSHMIGAGASLLIDRSPAPPPPPPPPPPEPEQRQQPLIDLNFPPAVEEDGSGNSQFVTW